MAWAWPTQLMATNIHLKYVRKKAIEKHLFHVTLNFFCIVRLWPGIDKKHNVILNLRNDKWGKISYLKLHAFSSITFVAVTRIENYMREKIMCWRERLTTELKLLLAEKEEVWTIRAFHCSSHRCNTFLRVVKRFKEWQCETAKTVNLFKVYFLAQLLLPD